MTDIFSLGFSASPMPPLTEAILELGPLHGQIMTVDAAEERVFEHGFYKRDPALTHVQKDGKRYAVYRWTNIKHLGL